MDIQPGQTFADMLIVASGLTTTPCTVVLYYLYVEQGIVAGGSPTYFQFRLEPV